MEELRALGDDLARWDEIQTEHARLAHVTTLLEGSHALIQGLDEGEAAVAGQLGEMSARLDAMQAVDDSLQDVAALLNSASADLAEAVHALRRYADNLNLDPERLAELDRRLGDMHRLARKHRVQPDALADLLATVPGAAGRTGRQRRSRRAAGGRGRRLGALPGARRSNSARCAARPRRRCRSR